MGFPFDVLDVAKSVTGMLSPQNGLIEGACNAIGLPPEVANVAEVALGIGTGNPIMALGGGAGLLGNILDEAGKTEFAPSKEHAATGYGSSDGYDGGDCGQGARGVISQHDPSFNDWLDGLFHKGGDIFYGLDSKITGSILGNHMAGYQKLQDWDHENYNKAVDFLFGKPHIREDFEKHFGCKIDDSRPRPPGGVAIQSDRTGDWSNPDSPLDPNITNYRHSLEVLQANWATFDTASSGRDGLVTANDLRAVAGNPNASPMMREACQFLLDNPEYFNRLEMAAGINGKDGLIGMIDVTTELKNVNADIAKYGVPGAATSSSKSDTDDAVGSSGSVGGSSSTSSTSGSGGQLNSILNDSSLTLEDKIQALLSAITDGVDNEIVDVMNQLDQANSKQVDAKDNKGAQDKQATIDKLTRKLQTLMERRKQMTELASNMSKDFNDMAMTAIHNMR